MSGEGKVVVITGAGQGIGEATARVFGERGATLILLDKNRKTLPGVAKRLEEEGVTVYPYIIDLTRTKELEALIEDVKGKWDVDVLINNAGFDRPGVSAKTGRTDFTAVLGIHLTVPFLLSKWLLPPMRRKRWGRIVNISSVYGLQGAKGEVAYSAAKAAIIGLTKTFAREGGPDGVTVNAIAPGLIRTPPMIRMADKYKDPIVAQTVLGRMGEPREIATVAAFLASDDASYVSGTTITVAGGWGM